jgi:hydrogenase maturation protease
VQTHNPSAQSPSENKRVLVIGLGNLERSDDGVGVVIARRLRQAAPSCVTVKEVSGDLTSLFDVWRDYDEVILVDAMHAGDALGRFRWFDVSETDLPEATVAEHSTHAFGLHQAIAMARALGELPRRVLVIGVQGVNFASGEMLSPAVRDAVDGIVSAILARIGEKEGTHA